jgi:hypothetical protein
VGVSALAWEYGRHPANDLQLSGLMDVEPVIGAFGECFDPDEAAIAVRMLHEHPGTVSDAQLIEEIGLAIAVHRRRGR